MRKQLPEETIKKIKVKVQALLCSVHLYPINSWVSLTLYKRPLRFPHRSHVIPEIDVFLYRQTELVIICEMAKSKGYTFEDSIRQIIIIPEHSPGCLTASGLGLPAVAVHVFNYVLNG